MNDFDEVVMNMMQRFGSIATLVITGDAVYDPTTRKNTAIETEIPVEAILLDNTLQSNGLGVSKDSLIQVGDKIAYVRPANKTDPNITMPKLESNKTRIKFGTDIYKVITSKDLNPTTTDSILLELYVRK